MPAAISTKSLPAGSPMQHSRSSINGAREGGVNNRRCGRNGWRGWPARSSSDAGRAGCAQGGAIRASSVRGIASAAASASGAGALRRRDENRKSRRGFSAAGSGRGGKGARSGKGNSNSVSGAELATGSSSGNRKSPFAGARGVGRGGASGIAGAGVGTSATMISATSASSTSTSRGTAPRRRESCFTSRAIMPRPIRMSPVEATTAPHRIIVLPKENSLIGIPNRMATTPAQNTNVPASNNAIITQTPGCRLHGRSFDTTYGGFTTCLMKGNFSLLVPKKYKDTNTLHHPSLLPERQEGILSTPGKPLLLQRFRKIKP